MADFISVIGTGGDFATPQAWENSLPATVNAGDRYIGRLKDETFSSSGFVIQFDNVVTNNGQVILEPMPGAAFYENMTPGTTPLRVDAALGALLTSSGTEGPIFIGSPGITVRNIQLRNSANTRLNGASGTDADCTFERLLCECLGTVTTEGVKAPGNNFKILNSAIKFAISPTAICLNAFGLTGCEVHGSTIVAEATPDGFADAFLVKNTIFFGFEFNGPINGASDYNATDLASTTGANSLTSIADPFVDSAGADYDYRPTASAAVLGEGIEDTTNNARDIYNIGRPSPPDIGAAQESPLVAQKARPNSDVSGGDWKTDVGGTTLFGAIDESVPVDTDFIHSGADPSNDICEVALPAIPDPGTANGHKLRYRIVKKGEGTIDAEIQLRQGTTTVIASWLHENLDAAVHQFERHLTAGQANAISDYGDLRLRFIANPP